MRSQRRSRAGKVVLLLWGLSTLAALPPSTGAVFAETTAASGDSPPQHRDVREGRPPFQESLPAVAQGFCPQLALTTNGAFSGNARAPIISFQFERAVYLITAAELAAHGFVGGTQLHGIGWSYRLNTFVSASAPLKVYLQNTADATNTKSTTWSTATTGMTLTHDTVTPLPPKRGSFGVTFTGGSPFVYNGGGLYVAFEWGQYTGTLIGNSIWCESTLANSLLGGQSNTSFPTTLIASNFRPETFLMTENAAVDDRSVDVVALYGELALGLAPPVTVRSALGNHNGVPATNVPLTLQVTGPVTFSDPQVAPSIDGCGTAYTSFAPFTASAVGNYAAIVSIPPDGVPANDSRGAFFTVGAARYTVNYPSETGTGGVGYNGATGYLVARFPTLAATRITHVNLAFSAPVDPAARYRVVVYDDAGGTPGTLLYEDAADRTIAAGPVNIVLSVPQDVAAGAYYVGAHQTSTVNMGLTYASEDPIRAGSFFERSTPTWRDYDASNSPFKPFIGVSLDRCVTPIAASNGPVCNGTTIQLSGGPPGALSYEWTGPNGFTSDEQNPSIPSASSVHAGEYGLRVNGCEAEVTTTVVVNDSFTITASANAGGSIDPSGAVSVDCGSSREFTFTPDPGYVVRQVVVDGDSIGAVPAYTFSNVTSDHTIISFFKVPLTAPPYQPGTWNDGPGDPPDPDNGQDGNNCYNYATNQKTGTFAQPGRQSGNPPATFDCAGLLAAANADGLVNSTAEAVCVNGFKIALVHGEVQGPDGKEEDFHWYRQDANGKWSHKPGQTEATSKDADGNDINDPQTAAKGTCADGTQQYANFCGYLCVTKATLVNLTSGGVEGAALPGLRELLDSRGSTSTESTASPSRSLSNEIIVNPIVFSGNEDATTTFTSSADLDSITSMLSSLAAAPDPGWQSRLGYRGFRLRIDDVAPLGSARVRVWGGVIRVDQGSNRNFYVDSKGLERWLRRRYYGPTVSVPSTVSEIGRLGPPRPNPFTRGTTFALDLDRSSRVALKIYDVSGRMVRQLVDREIDAGHHEVGWDGRDADGRALRSGTYFYKLILDGRVVGAEKAVLLKN